MERRNSERAILDSIYNLISKKNYSKVVMEQCIDLLNRSEMTRGMEFCDCMALLYNKIDTLKCVEWAEKAYQMGSTNQATYLCLIDGKTIDNIYKTELLGLHNSLAREKLDHRNYIEAYKHAYVVTHEYLKNHNYVVTDDYEEGCKIMQEILDKIRKDMQENHMQRHFSGGYSLNKK